MKILIVIGDAQRADALNESLIHSFEGCGVKVCTTAQEARSYLKDNFPSLIISDYELPDGTVMTILGAKGVQVPWPVLVIDQSPNELRAVEVIKAGALNYGDDNVSSESFLKDTIAQYLSEWQKVVSARQEVDDLRHSRQLLQSVLDTIPVRVFWKNKYSVYLGCNRLFAEDSDLSGPENIIGKNDFDMTWRDQAELYRADDQQVITSGEPKLSFEEPQTAPDGSPLLLETSKIPLRDLDGQIIGVLGTYRNITEEKKALEALKSSEAKNRAILNALPDLIFQIHYDGTFASYNAAADELYIPPEEFLGKKIEEVLPPEVASQCHEHLDQLGETGAIQTFNYELKVKNKTQYFEARMVRCDDDSVLVIVRNISDRIQAEHKLDETLQTSAEIVAAIPSGLFIYRFEPPDKLILIDANPEAEYLTGVKLEQWRGREFNELWPAAFKSGMTENFLKVVQTGKPYAVDSYAYKDDKIEGCFRIRAFALSNNRLGVAFENITERTRVYEALRSSESRYRFMYKNIPVMLHSIDPKGRLTNVSNHWLETMGYAKNEVIGQKLTSFMTAESRINAENTVLPHSWKEDVCRDVPYQFVKKNGDVIDTLLSAVIERNSQNEVVGSYAAVIDVTRLNDERKKTYKFFRAVEQSPAMVMIVDIAGCVEYVNPQFTEITGFASDEVLGREIHDLWATDFDSSFFKSIWNVVNSGNTWVGHVQNRRKDGESYWERFTMSPIIDEGGEIVNYLVISEDITGEMLVHQKWSESDKLTAIGLLAAGVAHEFKNYLCGIIGNASLMMDDDDDIRDPEKVRETMDTIIKIGDKASDLANSLLSYSKAPSDKFEKCAISDLVTKAISLVESEMTKSNIEVLTYFEETPEIEVVSGKIQQLFLNLLSNARQAIKSNGVITISVTSRNGDIIIRVGDTGGGIPPAAMSQIFNPFYSTKGVWGKDDQIGVGLGLAMCRNIVRDHNGEITVDSIVGAGSCFTVTLPAEQAAPDGEMTIRDIPPETNILLCTQNKRTIGGYFPAAQRLHLGLFAVDSPVYFKQNNDARIDLVVFDAALNDNGSIENMIAFCNERKVPLAIINVQDSDQVKGELLNAAAVVYQSNPDLEIILGAVGHRVLATSLNTPSR